MSCPTDSQVGSPSKPSAAGASLPGALSATRCPAGVANPSSSGLPDGRSVVGVWSFASWTSVAPSGWVSSVPADVARWASASSHSAWSPGGISWPASASATGAPSSPRAAPCRARGDAEVEAREGLSGEPLRTSPTSDIAESGVPGTDYGCNPLPSELEGSGGEASPWGAAKAAISVRVPSG